MEKILQLLQHSNIVFLFLKKCNILFTNAGGYWFGTLPNDLSFKTNHFSSSLNDAAETRTFFAERWRVYSWSISSITWHISESKKRQLSSKPSQLMLPIKQEEVITFFFFFSCMSFHNQLFSLSVRTHKSIFFMMIMYLPSSVDIILLFYLFFSFQFQHVFDLSILLLLISLTFMLFFKAF